MAQHTDRFSVRVVRVYSKDELTTVEWTDRMANAAPCLLVLFSNPVTGHWRYNNLLSQSLLTLSVAQIRLHVVKWLGC